MQNPSTDCAWEDSAGLVHWVPFSIGNRYTSCDVRIAWAPGVWSEMSVNCVTCLAVRKRLTGKANEQVVPLRREAGMFIFRWPFRTTANVIHGVVVPPRMKYFYELPALCSISTYAKLEKGTGKWTHGRESLTCIGCLATMKVSDA